MSEVRPKRLKDDPTTREELREKLDRYLDVPLALASVVVVLLIIIQLSGELAAPWQGRVEILSWILWGLFFAEFMAKFILAPVKRRYLRTHWLDVLVVLLPFLKFLRLARVLRATRALPVLRLLIFGGRGSSSTLALLKRRRLGQLGIVSGMVVLIGASIGYLLEIDAPGSNIQSFGDALWWAATLVTTIGSEISPSTTGGRIVAFLLMLYAVGIFSYFIGAIASVLVETDRRVKEEPKSGIGLDEQELEALRSILEKSERNK
ncbi:MAG: ion transporter [Actinomycetota bacterium]|nr:ion transporter [Actinomycetota bacterium]